MKNILIVGAGITGATCARILCNTYNITVIDKANVIGGTCYDYLSEDQSCYIHKFGPHIFHTLNKNIWDFVNQFDNFNNYVHCVYTQVNNEIYTFPINLNVISKLFNTQIYSKQDADKLIHDKYFENPKNFEEAAINSVGTKIYNAFIKNYTQKQWNCNPKDLPVEIFNRINIRYNYDNGYFPNAYQGQPSHGYTNLIKNILDHKNIKVILNQNFETFNTNNFDLIIYTGSFNGLEYRSIYFDHFILTKNNNFSVLNTPNDEKITRITNFNILHKLKDSNIFNYCKEFPAKNNQYNELYPIYSDKNLKIYQEKTNQLKDKYKNILFAGRLGLYKYFDMDKAIEDCLNICNTFI